MSKINALDILNTPQLLQEYQHQRYVLAKTSPELDLNVLHMQIALDFLQSIGYTVTRDKAFNQGEDNE